MNIDMVSLAIGDVKAATTGNYPEPGLTGIVRQPMRGTLNGPLLYLSDQFTPKTAHARCFPAFTLFLNSTQFI